MRRSQLPPVLGGDGGVYIKWALVLQEQLAHVQGERAGLAEQVAGLKLENEQLRQALEAGNTAGTAASATPGAAALALPGASGADAASAEAGADQFTIMPLGASCSDQNKIILAQTDTGQFGHNSTSGV